METVGKYLKRERELRNISLKEVSRATKIRESLLQAVEEDRHDLLPTPVFVKGFLIAYGKHIGLDPSDLVLRYESDLKELHGEEEQGLPSQPRRGLTRGVIVGAIVVLIGIGVILLNLGREPIEREESPPPLRTEETPVVQEEPPPPPVVPEQEKVTPPTEETIVIKEPPPREETIAVAETPPAESPPETPLSAMTSEPREMGREHLTLQIEAVEETWIALQVDSNLPREITLKIGEIFSQRADDHIKLKIGNAGGVNVTFNGKPLGSLGDPGKVVRLNLTHEGYEFKRRDDFEISGYEEVTKPAEAN
jgi:cytoskeleton protein RodZ